MTTTIKIQKELVTQQRSDRGAARVEDSSVLHAAPKKEISKAEQSPPTEPLARQLRARRSVVTSWTRSTPTGGRRTTFRWGRSICMTILC